MVNLRKEEIEPALDTRRTVQRLVSVIDQERFNSTIKSECTRRERIIEKRLTEAVDQLVAATAVEGKIESRRPPENQIQPIVAELDAVLATQRAANADYQEALVQRNRARQAIENFKFRHDRIDQPELAESNLLHAGTLLALLFGETVINSVSFGEVSASGLLGGFGQAFLFTIVNLALATFGAWCFKYKNHFDPNLRVFGWASIAVFGLLGFLYNCFVGHYRQALGAVDFEDAIRNSAASFYENNAVGISDGGALLLVILGLVIFWFAFMKIYGFEDPYPGYPKVGRREKEASARLNERREENLLPDLRKAYEQAVQKMNSMFETYSEYVHACSMSLESKKQLSYEIAGLTPRCKVVLRELIDDFVHQLQSAPLQCQIPEVDVSFYVDPLQPMNPPPDFDFGPDEEVLGEIEQWKEQFSLRVNDEIANIQADLADDIERLRTVWEEEDTILTGAVNGA